MKTPFELSRDLICTRIHRVKSITKSINLLWPWKKLGSGMNETEVSEVCQTSWKIWDTILQLFQKRQEMSYATRVVKKGECLVSLGITAIRFPKKETTHLLFGDSIVFKDTIEISYLDQDEEKIHILSAEEYQKVRIANALRHIK